MSQLVWIRSPDDTVNVGLSELLRVSAEMACSFTRHFDQKRLQPANQICHDKFDESAISDHPDVAGSSMTPS